MRTDNASDLCAKCELALKLVAAATEALRDSIHNFAIGIRAEDAASQ
jgi:hypothetical protein